MVWQRICMTMLAGAMASMLALPLRGDDLKKDDPKEQVPAPKGADGCGDNYRTIHTWEWVPETHMVKKTCYRHECRDVVCTVNKTQLVPEQRTKCVTCRHMVPECHEVCCTVRVCVPYTVEKCCIERRVTCKEVCTTHRRIVDRGHWECCEVPTLGSRLGRLRRHHGDCCNPCGNDCCNNHCTRTVRHWVSCKVCEEVPCKHIVRCVECVPVKKCVTCYRHECQQVMKKVTGTHSTQRTMCLQ